MTEPFGYFKAEPFGWTDCAEADEGAVALYAAPPAQPEFVAWPCVIAEADFEQNTITLEMQCSDYKAGAGQHWLSKSRPAPRIWVGLTHDEYDAICDKHSAMSDFDFLADIEAKLREKNQ